MIDAAFGESSEHMVLAAPQKTDVQQRTTPLHQTGTSHDFMWLIGSFLIWLHLCLVYTLPNFPMSAVHILVAQQKQKEVGLSNNLNIYCHYVAHNDILDNDFLMANQNGNLSWLIMYIYV